MLQFGQAWVTSFILSINSGIMQQGTQPTMQRNPERIHCKPEISLLTSVVMFDLQLGHFILTASSSKLVQRPPEKTKFDHNIFGALFLFFASRVKWGNSQNSTQKMRTYSRLRNKQRGTLNNFWKFFEAEKNLKWPQCLDRCKKALKSWCENF